MAASQEKRSCRSLDGALINSIQAVRKELGRSLHMQTLSQSFSTSVVILLEGGCLPKLVSQRYLRRPARGPSTQPHKPRMTFSSTSPSPSSPQSVHDIFCRLYHRSRGPKVHCGHLAVAEHTMTNALSSRFSSHWPLGGSGLADHAHFFLYIVSSSHVCLWPLAECCANGSEKFSVPAEFIEEWSFSPMRRRVIVAISSEGQPKSPVSLSLW